MTEQQTKFSKSDASASMSRSLSQEARRDQASDFYFRQRMIQRFAAAAETAATKNFVSELTREEAVAICIFGGASCTIEDGKIVTEACGLHKTDGRWTVVTYAH